MKRYILVLLVGIILATPVYADIVVKHNEKANTYEVNIINEITKSDYDKLVDLVFEAEKHTYVNVPFQVKLDSNGGDVETALKIGRLLREKSAFAMVSPDAICLSSCVFILAGATSRMRFGKIGIHRPYDPTDTVTSAADQKAKYNKLGNLVKTYLSEMNVKPQLYDDMLYISPEDIRILSKEDLDSYGLTSADPFEMEAIMAIAAKERGVSREEFAKRTARQTKECRLDLLFDSEDPEYKEAEEESKKCYDNLMNDRECRINEKVTKCYDDIMNGRR